jgi:hypothetical protein
MKLTSHLFMGMLLSVLMAGAVMAGPLVLLSAKEAARVKLPEPKPGLLPLAESGGEKPAPRAPKIIVDQPTNSSSVHAPFPIKIRFVPSSGNKINLDSVEIDVHKLVKISLVSRLKPYLTHEGINVPDAQIPSGTYNIHVALADDHGHRTETTQTWMVQ